MAPRAITFRSRRDFIRNTAFVSLGFMALKAMACRPLADEATTELLSGPGYGPLVADPVGIIDLPEGFRYKVISSTSKPMSDGLTVPGKPDGMATFIGNNGRIILVRNHEMELVNVDIGAYGAHNENMNKVPAGKFYDSGNGTDPGQGGTTTLVINEDTLEVEKEFMSLAGTYRNCAGGPTPWNSWVTCEEDVTRVGGFNGMTTVDHGYVFEVPASETIGLADPVPIKEMGRFNHEAICVDPATGIVYLTEDRPDGLFYRFIPNVKGDLHSGGRLQALAIVDKDSFDTRNWPTNTTEKMLRSKPMPTRWIDMTDVESPNDDLRFRGFTAGAARFARGEGIWFGDNELYFTCTNGGNIMKGQIFRYRPGKAEGEGQDGTIELFVETESEQVMKSCDNLTVAPWGDLMVCEDDPAPFLRGVTRDGHIYDFGRNRLANEFTGICFSPSGRTMFVNIQHEGLTLAIQGKWRT